MRTLPPAFYEYGEPILIEPEHVLTLPLASMTAAERKEFDTAGQGRRTGVVARSGQPDNDARFHLAGHA